MRFLLATGTLVQREWIRFVRQKNRIIGAIGTPLVFWFFIGSGIGSSFNSGVTYLQYFLPGTILLVSLFTSIFSTISIIEDRREGFLQGVLVSPAPRGAIVLGKLLGGSFLGTAQGLLFLVILPFVGLSIDISRFLLLALILFIATFGLTGLGFIFAWRLDSTQGFHAIMNLLLMPLWFLSGALFPMKGVPPWLELLMRLNPLTYATSVLQSCVLSRTAGPAAPMATPTPISVCVVVLFSVLTFAGATAQVRSS